MLVVTIALCIASAGLAAKWPLASRLLGTWCGGGAGAGGDGAASVSKQEVRPSAAAAARRSRLVAAAPLPPRLPYPQHPLPPPGRTHLVARKLRRGRAELAMAVKHAEEVLVGLAPKVGVHAEGILLGGGSLGRKGFTCAGA
jgi:hypothetical protein